MNIENGRETTARNVFPQTFDFSMPRRKHKAPYVPLIRHPEDTSNFDADNLGDDVDDNANGGVAADDEDLSNSNVHPGVKNEDYGFYEFTFRRFWNDYGHPRDPLPHEIKPPPERPDAVYV